MRDDTALASAAPDDGAPYDEMALVAENAAEMGVSWPNPELAPQRVSFAVAGGQQVSAIRWGEAAPATVYLHGGGQNAHTWDSVIVGRCGPALAIDLPGHGRSDRRADRNYSPWQNALAVAEILDQLPAPVRGVVGMSLGGATTIRLAARWPQLVNRAVVVDVTPQVNDPGRVMTPEQRGSVALVSGPPSYATFDEVFDATLAASPNRTRAGIFRGVRHNTLKLPDGRWAWRYDLFGRTPEQQVWTDFTPLWDDVGDITIPTMLVVGGSSVYVLAEDVERFRGALPSVRVETVPGAGHAVQSDQPAALVELLSDYLHPDRAVEM